MPVSTVAPVPTIILRRRGALLEAGLPHSAVADFVSTKDGISTTRQAVTKGINGKLSSGGLRIEQAVVELLQIRFKELGRPQRAEQITMQYMGWGA